MISVLASIVVAYCIFIFLLIKGWHNIHNNRQPLPAQPGFTVVIPVRNEEDNIRALLHDLEKQNYADKDFEVIVVDDHSEDGTCYEVQSVMQQSSLNLRYLHLENARGKKAALAWGISHARHEIILTTDGDCRVAPGWISAYACYFGRNDCRMAFGAVTFTDHHALFGKLQHIEFAALIGTGAAMLQLGCPTFCNGANLAFAKEAFIEVGGYRDNQHIPSGDDEFLLHKIYRRFPGKVSFVKNREAIVSTQAVGSPREFLWQRVRWASKWRMQGRQAVKWLAGGIFFANLAVVTALVFAGPGLVFWPAVLLLTILKGITEYIFIKRIMNWMRVSCNIFHFLLLEIIYPFYAIFFGVVSNFGRYQWKGRDSRSYLALKTSIGKGT